MKHAVSKQQVLLFVSGELSEADRRKIETHLKKCAVCRKEADDVRAVHSFLRTHEPSPSERTLTAWRRDVVRAIRNEKPAPSVVAVVREFFGFADGQLARPALSLVAIACLAFVLGYSTAGNDMAGPERFAPAAFDPFGSPTEFNGQGDAQVMKVDILSKDDATGEIEFEFEALFRSRVNGNMADPSIQAILARALVSSQNPGVRLRAVNAFSGSAPEHQVSRQTQEVIKQSLVSAVKYDENQGVRQEALRALRSFMPDTAATSAIVHVLLNDKSAAMKIAAINSLDLTKYHDPNELAQLSEVLRDRSLNDENNYIRIKAKAALQEVLQ